VTRAEAILLRSCAIWTLWVWGTRIGNVLGDDSRSFGFKAVHVFLAVVSVAFAVGLWIVASRGRRRNTSH
jgi:hypothetical protein